MGDKTTRPPADQHLADFGDVISDAETAAQADEPLVALELLQQRAEIYDERGVPPVEALRLACEDAIATCDAAHKLDETGPVGGLIDQSHGSRDSTRDAMPESEASFDT